MSIGFRALVCSSVIFVAATTAALAQTQTPSPQGAAVYFINLKDGDTVTSPFKVQFGLTGMGIAPVGVQNERTGHHHLLIDTELPPLDQPVPNDFNHLHFGNGQTEAQLTLKTGSHTLQLLFADKDHIPHNPPVMSALIHVTVAEPKPPAAAVPARKRAQTAARQPQRANPPYKWHPGIYYRRTN